MTAHTQCRRPVWRIVVALLILAMGVWACGLLYLGNRADTAEVQRDDAAATARDLAVQLADVCANDPAGAAEANLQCSRAEQVAAEGPQGDPGPPGPPGERGRAPTPEEIAAAVEGYCASGRCSQPPSPDIVLAAVTEYCAAGNCRGAPGEDGADSTAPGPQGPPGPEPTAEQVAAAVESYCSGGACTGPQGPPGEPGADGSPPAGWTWRDALTGVTYDCTRDPGSSDESPTYTCTAR